MSYKQAGFQEAWIQGGNSYVAILHGTNVVGYSRAGGVIILKSGGWHTRATAKAMNRGLQAAGLERFHVKLEKGQLVLIECDHDTLPKPIGNALELSL